MSFGADPFYPSKNIAASLTQHQQQQRQRQQQHQQQHHNLKHGMRDKMMETNRLMDTVASDVNSKDIQRIWNNVVGGSGGGGGGSVPVGALNDSLFTKSSPLNIPLSSPTSSGSMFEQQRYGVVPGNSLPTASQSLFGMDHSVAVGGSVGGGGSGVSGGMTASSFPNIGGLSFSKTTNVGGGSSVGALIGGAGMVPIVEFEMMQLKCMQWEESWNQAKAACTAWEKAASDASDRLDKFKKTTLLKLEELERKKTNNGGSGGGGEIDMECLKYKTVEELKELLGERKVIYEAVEKELWRRLPTPPSSSSNK